MDRPRISLRSLLEAELSEHFQHRGVLGQNFRGQFLQSGIPGDLDKVTHQHRTDPTSLPSIDDDERHLGPTGLKNNVTTAADDNRAAILLCYRIATQRHPRTCLWLPGAPVNRGRRWRPTALGAGVTGSTVVHDNSRPLQTIATENF
jgi:hypothetical protein